MDVIKIKGKSFLVLKPMDELGYGYLLGKYDNCNFAVYELKEVDEESIKRVKQMGINVKSKVGELRYSNPIAFFSTTQQMRNYLTQLTFLNSTVEELDDLFENIQKITPNDVELRDFLKNIGDNEEE